MAAAREASAALRAAALEKVIAELSLTDESSERLFGGPQRFRKDPDSHVFKTCQSTRPN